MAEHKIIKGAKEALKVARCDHDLIAQPHTGNLMRKFYCRKCQATIWEPKRR